MLIQALSFVMTPRVRRDYLYTRHLKRCLATSWHSQPLWWKMNQTWGYLWLSPSHSESASHFWPSSCFYSVRLHLPPARANHYPSGGTVMPGLKTSAASDWFPGSALAPSWSFSILQPVISWSKCTSHRPLRASQWLLPHFQPCLGCSQNTSARHQRSLGLSCPSQLLLLPQVSWESPGSLRLQACIISSVRRPPPHLVHL